MSRSSALRGRLQQNADDETRTRAKRWNDNTTILKLALAQRDMPSAEAALDRLEALADVDEEIRTRLLGKLDDSSFYDPIWTADDVLACKALLSSLSEDCAEAAGPHQALFHRYATTGRLSDAEGVLSTLRLLGCPTDEIQALHNRLPARPLAAGTEDPLISLLRRGPLRVLFLGGGAELTGQHADEVKKLLAEEYGAGLEVDFFCDAWAKNYGKELPALEAKIPRYDTSLLSNKMRTGIGRHLRRMVNDAGKIWGGCTTTGTASVAQAIRDAARRFSATQDWAGTTRS